MLGLLVSTWLAQAIDARATEPGTHWVKIGMEYDLTISMRGECRDSSCSGGGTYETADLGQEAPELVIPLEIAPADSDVTFELPYRIGGGFVPPVSGQIQVKLREEVTSAIQETAKDKCSNFEVKQLTLTSVVLRGTQP